MEQQDNKISIIIKYIIIAVVAVFTVLPFVIILTSSLTPESQIRQYGFSIIPREISLESYRYLFNDFSKILNAYKITGITTVIGSSLGILLTVLLAYPTSKDFLPGRRFINFFILFPILFSGGMVPWYIVCTKYLGMKNNIWALILPIVVLPFQVILMRSFFQTLSEAFRESAIMDGAGEWRILFSIILPLSLPGIATIGLFIALRYWNDWYLPLMLITDKKFFNLQFLLKQILSNIQAMLTDESGQFMGELPSEGVKMATCIVAIGPVLLFYPFVQRYFIRGITLGGIKG